MKHLAILTLLASLACAGCVDPFEPRARADWEVAPRTHLCTEDQMAKAQREAKWCTDNTSYYGSACYGFAILRNCQKIK